MSTVQTTASDRVRAAAVAVAAATKGPVLRYRDLTSLTETDMDCAARQLESIKAKAATKASKQVRNEEGRCMNANAIVW